MPRVPKAAITPAELDALVVKAAAAKPLAAGQLRAALPPAYRPGETQWRELLARLVSEGRLHKWPVRRGVYATSPYDAFARGRVRAVLADGPLGKAAIEKLSGVSRRVLDRLLGEMRAAGELHTHRGRRYGSRPADDLDYVLRPELEKLARAHVARGAAAESVKAAVARWAGAPPVDAAPAAPAAAASSGQAILDTMLALNPQAAHGDLVYLPHLRTALKDRFLDKVSFDRAVLALAEQRRVQLQSHPVPSEIKPAERESMIEDGSGSYYMVIGLRR